MNSARLTGGFFTRDVLEVAPDLLGKNIVVKKKDAEARCRITEVEAYRGEDDLACHASKGKTARNYIMYEHGGFIYVYFIYGMYWMLNVVTGPAAEPQAVLIRAVEGFAGPGKLTRELGIDRSFYGENLEKSARIWVEEGPLQGSVATGHRIGIDYAGEYWMTRPWRYFIV